MTETADSTRYIMIDADEIALAIVRGIIDNEPPVRDPPASAAEEMAHVARCNPDLAADARRAALLVGRLLAEKLPGSKIQQRPRRSH